jgi:hypothetical protein
LFDSFSEHLSPLDQAATDRDLKGKEKTASGALHESFLASTAANEQRRRLSFQQFRSTRTHRRDFDLRSIHLASVESVAGATGKLEFHGRSYEESVWLGGDPHKSHDASLIGVVPDIPGRWAFIRLSLHAANQAKYDLVAEDLTPLNFPLVEAIHPGQTLDLVLRRQPHTPAQFLKKPTKPDFLRLEALLPAPSQVTRAPTLLFNYSSAI